MPRQLTFEEGLELTRKSGLFSEAELQQMATGHALDVLMWMMGDGPGPEPKPEEGTAEG